MDGSHLRKAEGLLRRALRHFLQHLLDLHEPVPHHALPGQRSFRLPPNLGGSVVNCRILGILLRKLGSLTQIPSNWWFGGLVVCLPFHLHKHQKKPFKSQTNPTQGTSQMTLPFGENLSGAPELGWTTSDQVHA